MLSSATKRKMRIYFVPTRDMVLLQVFGMTDRQRQELKARTEAIITIAKDNFIVTALSKVTA